MFQKKYSEAVEPADRGYKIRLKVLGNHPLTVRSIFQRAVIQANFGEFEKALKLFLEAWEMEKSLGAGNHSEVWRKIITGVEDMYDERAKRKKLTQYLAIFFSKKKQFRKDALKFCKRFWNEEKRSAHFNFTEYNKGIIDTLLYLVRDKKDKDEAEKDALWFYEEMQRTTEETFQQEFDQETDNSDLNEMLKERDELLDKVMKFCLNRAEHGKLARQKAIKLVLYKKVLVRPDFVGERKLAYDKEKLIGQVEQLYRDVGEEEYIPEFQESLLRTWEKQWKEGKGGEKLQEFGVIRERTITGILQLCKELKKEEMFRRYGKEALSFYENLWEVKQANMKTAEVKKFLSNAKLVASSIGDHEREKIYDKALQTLERTGKHPGATLRTKANEIVEILPVKEIVSEYEKKYDGEEEEKKKTDDETHTSLHINPKTLIKRGEVSHKGDTWNLQEAAASVTFCRGAETEPLLIACSLWSPGALSPPLGSDEVLLQLSPPFPTGFSHVLKLHVQ